MRVLQFCNYADRIGGAEVYTHALLEALRERGHRVALFGSSPDRETDEEDLRVVRRPAYERARLVTDPAVREALVAFIARFEPDVVHLHNVFSVGLDVLVAIAEAEVPVLHTVHDYHLLCPNSWCVRGDGSNCPGGPGAQCFQHGCQDNYPFDAWTVLLGQLRQHLLAGCTSLALAPSTYLVERLRANGWAAVRRLPYFIDFTPAPAGTTRADAELIYAGRLEKEKGIDVLLRAMPEVLAACPGTRLDLLGGGSRASTLQRLARELQLGDSVRFLSSVRREELAGHYARATAAILPSVWTENSPLVAYECLLSGLPMVGSRIGGIPELIEPGAGSTFTPRDSGDLARRIVQLLRLPRSEREAMSAVARARAATFDKQEHLAALEAAYAEIASGARPSEAGRLGLLCVGDLLAALEATDRDAVSGPPRGVLELLRPLARRLGLPKLVDP